MLAHGRSPAAVPEGGFAAMKAVPRQLLASALALGCLSLALFYGLSRDMYGDVHVRAKRLERARVWRLGRPQIRV
jgi:hypothetical protein